MYYDRDQRIRQRIRSDLSVGIRQNLSVGFDRALRLASSTHLLKLLISSRGRSKLGIPSDFVGWLDPTRSDRICCRILWPEDWTKSEIQLVSVRISHRPSPMYFIDFSGRLILYRMCNELWLKADYIKYHYPLVKPDPKSSWHAF
jgi:hypothetical protein